MLQPLINIKIIGMSIWCAIYVLFTITIDMTCYVYTSVFSPGAPNRGGVEFWRGGLNPPPPPPPNFEKKCINCSPRTFFNRLAYKL